VSPAVRDHLYRRPGITPSPLNDQAQPRVSIAADAANPDAGHRFRSIRTRPQVRSPSS
jgi:hypothetical protein